MAHVKATSTTKLGRDSHSKRLGVKLFAGEKAHIGSILVRQRGTKYYPGKNVRKGSDDTLYAVAEGTVKFTRKLAVGFNGKRKLRLIVNVL